MLPRLNNLCAFAAAALLCGCDRGAQHASLRDAALPRLIPAHEFVMNRHGFSGFMFSPQGDRLVWSARSGGRTQLHVRDDASGLTRTFKASGGSAMHWSADGRRLIILDDRSGAENHHLYRLDVDRDGATPVDLTPYPGVRVVLHRILPDDPEHVLVLHNQRERTLMDIYRLNLSTGVQQMLARNPGNANAPLTDTTGNVRGWRAPSGPARPRGAPRPAPLQDKSALSRRSEDTLRMVGASKDRSVLWLVTNRGRDRTALLRVEPQTQKAAVVFEDAKVDVGPVTFSSQLGQPLLALASPGYPRVQVFDAALKADLEKILAPFADKPHGIRLESWDATQQRMVVAVYTDQGRSYYLIDRPKKLLSALGESRPAQFSQAMVAVEPHEIRARDGMLIPAFLLRPRGTQKKPLPLVLLVHGGPWQSVQWVDPDESEDLLRAQFLANRGYAVLLPNFRGSTGYGRNHHIAAVGEFGAKMQHDLEDALRWAITGGIADAKRIAVMGHSYGGYATLMSLAQQPKTYACGVAIAPPTDLAKLIETFPPYWENDLERWYSFVGDPAVAADRARMQRASPVNLAARIERRLLIIQGERDVRVPPSQANAMVEQLRKHGKQVRHISVAEMGHNMGYWAHHLLVLRESERFLGDCLGGRAARFDTMEWVARLSGRLPLRP